MLSLNYLVILSRNAFVLRDETKIVIYDALNESSLPTCGRLQIKPLFQQKFNWFKNVAPVFALQQYFTEPEFFTTESVPLPVKLSVLRQIPAEPFFECRRFFSAYDDFMRRSRFQQTPQPGSRMALYLLNTLNTDNALAIRTIEDAGIQI